MLEQSFFRLNACSATSWHKKTIALQLSPISSSLLYGISVSSGDRQDKKKRQRRKEGLGGGDLGAVKCGCRYTRGQTK